MTAYSANTIEKNCLLSTRTDHSLKIPRLNSIAGSSRIRLRKNCRSKLRWRSDHRWVKSSLSWSRRPRIVCKQRLFLSSTSRWATMKCQLQLKSMSTIHLLSPLWKISRFRENLTFYFSVSSTTQRSNAWSNCSARWRTPTLYPWPLRRLRESKSSSCLSRISARILTLTSSLLSFGHRRHRWTVKMQSRHKLQQKIASLLSQLIASNFTASLTNLRYLLIKSRS